MIFVEIFFLHSLEKQIEEPVDSLDISLELETSDSDSEDNVETQKESKTPNSDEIEDDLDIQFQFSVNEVELESLSLEENLSKEPLAPDQDETVNRFDWESYEETRYMDYKLFSEGPATIEVCIIIF